MSLYHFIKIAVYIVSIVLSMLGLSCFRFDQYIAKGKVREFHIFYIVASVALAYLFASFILSFAELSFIS